MNNTYLYVIGGWNLTYLNEVHRLKVDAEPSPGAWEQIEGMRAARFSSTVYIGFLADLAHFVHRHEKVL